MHRLSRKSTTSLPSNTTLTWTHQLLTRSSWSTRHTAFYPTRKSDQSTTMPVDRHKPGRNSTKNDTNTKTRMITVRSITSSTEGPMRRWISTIGIWSKNSSRDWCLESFSLVLLSHSFSCRLSVCPEEFWLISTGGLLIFMDGQLIGTGTQ